MGCSYSTLHPTLDHHLTIHIPATKFTFINYSDAIWQIGSWGLTKLILFFTARVLEKQ